MGQLVRQSGINTIGEVPWATHFCQFYETKQDLIDILVPYFRTGLESNEFCVWVTSEDLSTDEALTALSEAIPNFDKCIERGQIEVFPYDTWYIQDGGFDQERVLGGWVGKLNHGLSMGYDGIRISGNTCWLEKADWDDFATYENTINDVIGDYNMLVLCTYSLNKCGASEIAEVVGSHQFALITRDGKWETIETSDYKQSKELLRKERDFTSAILDTAGCLVAVLDTDGRIVRFNNACEQTTGYSVSEVVGRRFWDFLLLPEDVQPVREYFYKILKGKYPSNGENHWVTRNGDQRLISWSNTAITANDGSVAYVIATGIDVTERRRAEEALRSQLHALQQALLPAKPAVPKGYTLASIYLPAFEGQEIGGDFYDVFTTMDGRTAILIGDVSGKGIDAASFAAAARNTIRAFTYDSPCCGEAMTHANAVLCAQQTGRDVRFATAFLLVLDPKTGHISYSAAGHPPAVIRRADGSIEFLVSKHMPVGIMNYEYDDQESHLSPGDKIVLYTDGISESRQASVLFGLEGIERVLSEQGDARPDDLVDRLLHTAREWAGGRVTDDTAVILIERS